MAKRCEKRQNAAKRGRMYIIIQTIHFLEILIITNCLYEIFTTK